MQQGISLTGGDLPLFNDAISGLQTIQTIFNHELNHCLLDYYPSHYNSNPSIDASNRYFSLKNDISSDGHLPIPKAIDPRGILKAMKSQDLVYAPENVVEYYKASNNRHVFLLS